ncbi:MAG: hypothetical protein QGG40_04785 [Myxococcota bacterium]|jgi:hypothetical protein|nr:hypothetical protein [Myxococcota bacterium]
MTTPLLVALTLLACSEDPPPSKPAVGLGGAVALLEHDDWTITQAPTEEEIFAEKGCVTAQKGAETGTVCQQDCGGRSARDIAREVGAQYGYQVGDPESCATYLTFTGSPEIRRSVAGEGYLEPVVPEPQD